MVKVKLTELAYQQKKAILQYGRKEFGKKSAMKLSAIIKDFTNSLKDNPLMGKIEPLFEDSPQTYRSLTFHKHYKLIYYIEENIVYIADIWDTRQEPQQLTSRMEK